MLYTLYEELNYWWSRLNLIVLFAPVTRIDHTISELIKTAANDIGDIQLITERKDIWALLGPYKKAVDDQTLFCEQS